MSEGMNGSEKTASVEPETGPQGHRLRNLARSPAAWIVGILALLAAVELLATGIHEIQEFLFLGYFVPIAIAARYFPRKKAIATAVLTTFVYWIAFIPDLVVLEGEHDELLIELANRAFMFIALGIILSSFRTGIAKEKDKALSAETQRAERLQLMLEISTTVASSLKLEQVLQVLAERVVETVGTSFCRIALLDGGGDFLRTVATYPDREMDQEPDLSMTMALADMPEYRKAIETRTAVIIGGRRQEALSKMPSRERESMREAKSMLLYPLVVGDHAVGVVCIGERRNWDRSPFDSEKAQLCQTIVNQGAVAVGHALSHQALEEAFVGTIRSLAEAIDAKDPSTRGHSDWVSKYAVMIARQMGLGNGGIDELKYAGYLHDVGKIGIPDDILSKTSQLSAEEWKLMKKHPIVSARILDPVPISGTVKGAVRHHHERFDGKGYPYGLAGESIPMAARILAVADSYEAMTADRPYRKALSDEQAVAELLRCCGTQFDPVVVDAFLASLGRKPMTASGELESAAS